MNLMRRIAQQLTVALSIVLMLGAVIASAQAKTAHLGVVINTAAMPCHHALDSDASAKTPLDLCRDLCLTQAPDTLIAPNGIASTPAVVPVLLPVNTYVVTADIPVRPVPYTLAAQAPPRPAPIPASQKLLI